VELLRDDENIDVFTYHPHFLWKYRERDRVERTLPAGRQVPRVTGMPIMMNVEREGSMEEV